MKIKSLVIAFFSLLFSIVSCGNDDVTVNSEITDPEVIEVQEIKYLALGDSYTIGQSVYETCRFPEILKERIISTQNIDVSLKVIARTGWTTTNLLDAIASQNPSNDYDLVTLLIGVNNQYQNKPFSLYANEFPELLQKAIILAKGKRENVIVISIPDYAFTPFGQGSSNPQMISTQIDAYNDFAKNSCLENNVTFINITDITREGIENPELVASDGLHPSQLAYSRFVERIFPKAIEVLE